MPEDQFYFTLEVVIIMGFMMWSYISEWRWNRRMEAIQSDLDKIHMGMPWGKPYDWDQESDEWDRMKEHQREQKDIADSHFFDH